MQARSTNTIYLFVAAMYENKLTPMEYVLVGPAHEANTIRVEQYTDCDGTRATARRPTGRQIVVNEPGYT
jgi:hypothetical protein